MYTQPKVCNADLRSLVETQLLQLLHQTLLINQNELPDDGLGYPLRVDDESRRPSRRMQNSSRCAAKHFQNIPARIQPSPRPGPSRHGQDRRRLHRRRPRRLRRGQKVCLVSHALSAVADRVVHLCPGIRRINFRAL